MQVTKLNVHIFRVLAATTAACNTVNLTHISAIRRCTHTHTWFGEYVCSCNANIYYIERQMHISNTMPRWLYFLVHIHRTYGKKRNCAHRKAIMYKRRYICCVYIQSKIVQNVFCNCSNRVASTAAATMVWLHVMGCDLTPKLNI